MFNNDLNFGAQHCFWKFC